jgi:ketosteroid isomerase-like protein
MDHAATARSLYDFLNAGDIDGFGGRLADDFVEHEETPGLAPTKGGSRTSSGCNEQRSPTCR